MKTVHINMCLILDGYRVMTVFLFPYTPSCEPCLSAGGSLLLASYRQGVPVISTLGWYLRHTGKGGVGWYGRRRVYHITQYNTIHGFAFTFGGILPRTQNGRLQCAGYWCSEQFSSRCMLRSRCHLHFHLKSMQI